MKIDLQPIEIDLTDRLELTVFEGERIRFIVSPPADSVYTNSQVLSMTFEQLLLAVEKAKEGREFLRKAREKLDG